MKIENKSLPLVNSLTLEEKVAQMIMVDFDGEDIKGKVLDNLKEIPWGGVILFSRNIKNKDQLKKLNKDIYNINSKIPMYISLDQEGGLVNRVDFSNMHLSLGNMALGMIDDLELTEKVSFISGVELRELGFHLNFAPVVDVNINPNNPIIGVRSFGEDPKKVSRHGVASVKGFEKAGIASCAKHFPGHGDTSFDSHLCLASVNASLERIEKVEMPPFKAVIDNGVPSIMTAHVIFPAVDESKVPATLSYKALTGILREKMGFKGLIITDSMGMKAISDNYGVGHSAVMAVKAGADIVMMCGAFKNQKEAYIAIIDAVKKGEISMDMIDKAIERIFNFKKHYVLNFDNIPSVSLEERQRVILEAASRGVMVLYENKKILPIDPKNNNTILFSPNRLYKTLLDEITKEWSLYSYVKDKFTNLTRKIYDINNPQFNTFKDSIRDDIDLIILEVYTRGILSPKMQEICNFVINLAKEKKINIILVSLSSPYGIPKGADVMVTSYNYIAPSMEAIGARLLS